MGMLVANHTVDCAKNIQIYNYAHKVNGTEQLLEVAVWVIEVVSVSESFLLMPTHGSMATLLLNRIRLVPKFSSYRVTQVYRLIA